MKMLNSVRLTDNQKRVIAKIVAAPTPKVAAEEISNGVNLIQARDTLVDLKLITQSLEDTAELTDTGTKVAQDENIIDVSGQLTPDGEKFAYSDEFGGNDSDNTAQEAPAGGETGDMGGMGDMGSVPPATGQEPLMMSYAEPTRMPILRELLRIYR